MIAKWKKFRKNATKIINLQWGETFCENTCKQEKKLENAEVESIDDESTDSDHTLTNDKSTSKSYPLKGYFGISKGKLKKLNEKFGRVSNNFVIGECTKIKKVEKVNIGNLSNK